MTWLDEMNRAAVALALPGWEWRDDDVAEVDADYDNGGIYGGTFTIRVAVERHELASLREFPGRVVWAVGESAYHGRLRAHPEERGYADFARNHAEQFLTALLTRRDDCAVPTLT
jgi:hypothetical protein